MTRDCFFFFFIVNVTVQFDIFYYITLIKVKKINNKYKIWNLQGTGRKHRANLYNNEVNDLLSRISRA